MRLAAHEVVADASATAPWLVMVHGFSQDRRAFDAQRDAFRARYRLLLIDLPGHGASSAHPGPYGHAELAAAVDDVLGAVIDTSTPGVFWGTHTGAAVALLLAARNPARFAALVLEGAVLPGRPMASVTETFARVQRVAVTQGLAEDVLVLSGGVSQGDCDWVPTILERAGVECIFHGVDLRPGKPLWFGVQRVADRSTLVFGLPGNMEGYPTRGCPCRDCCTRGGPR